MTTELTDGKIEIGVFANFKHGNTVMLMLGGSYALQRMSSLLTDGAKPFPKDVHLKDDPLFLLHNIDLFIKYTSENVGLKKTAANSYEWRLSPPVCIYFSELLKSLASADHPAHQYLESHGQDDLVIMASKGEYQSDIFSKA